tara:strand:+ start:12409 stop:13227 length:819 start_codon:yes stop_codon:yes gene_type:complete
MFSLINFRGYFYQRLVYRTHFSKKKYFLNFKGKANYKKFNKYGIPIVSYNGNNILFPISILNYFLGKIDSDSFNNKDIEILNYYIKNYMSNNNLFIHDFFEKNWKNKPIWYSSLPQSIFFSILIRLDNKKLNKIKISLKKAFNSIFHKKVYSNGIFLEYPNIRSQPQNGQMFGMFALIDAYKISYIDKKNFIFHLNKTYQLSNNQMTWYGWTKYNDYRLSSPFYHLLHIDMYKVLSKYDNRFLKLIKRAKFGWLFYIPVILFKIYEKIFRGK